jgi:hypothetical protein
MTLAAFRRSLGKPRPPAGLEPALVALWWAGRDKWSRAHDLAMAGEGPDSAWVHAYLHRRKGDLENAGYWYRQSRKRRATGSLEAEWTAIAAALLAKSR